MHCKAIVKSVVVTASVEGIKTWPRQFAREVSCAASTSVVVAVAVVVERYVDVCVKVTESVIVCEYVFSIVSV